MIILNLIKNWLIIVAGVILIIALSPIQQLKKQLPEGPLRSKWNILTILILFFFAGFMIFVVSRWNMYLDISDLIVPFIFFFGAIFVLLTSSLTMQTARDLLRISTLEEENITDPLMGIHNRRHFDRRLKEEMGRARRYGTSLVLFMIDVDHFKKVNDNFGHDMGDRVLVKLSSIIQDNVRRTDITSRYGGEEIAIIAPETTLKVAFTLGERLRERIENTVIVEKTPDHPDIRVTVSIGIAELRNDIITEEDFIRCADTALYRAKQSGRNRVLVNEDSCPETT